MIVQVVFGAVLIVLGLCALLGLPAIALHLERRDERTHEFESKIERAPKDQSAPPQVAGEAKEPDIVYH